MIFGHTDYYRDEFGEGLSRKFLGFSSLITPEKLSEIKVLTNRIEDKFRKEGRRLINIDPGYLDMAKLVLASTKDFMHRIYLDRGIYAEITLSYQNKSFRSFDWTYPDYRSKEYIDIFNEIREAYRQQIEK